ncbi:MAG: hypothetical protein NTZ39_02140 [Methanoregula sp.]|nr:hypothetical protein [Methanoregula sp.]
MQMPRGSFITYAGAIVGSSARVTQHWLSTVDYQPIFFSYSLVPCAKVKSRVPA